jgi:hypothetical protein
VTPVLSGCRHDDFELGARTQLSTIYGCGDEGANDSKSKDDDGTKKDAMSKDVMKKDGGMMKKDSK